LGGACVFQKNLNETAAPAPIPAYPPDPAAKQGRNAWCGMASMPFTMSGGLEASSDTAKNLAFCSAAGDKPGPDIGNHSIV
jgi:hypothetical protein